MNYCSEEGVGDLRELLGMSREEKPKAEKPKSASAKNAQKKDGGRPAKNAKHSGNPAQKSYSKPAQKKSTRGNGKTNAKGSRRK